MNRNGFRDTLDQSPITQELIERGFTKLLPPVTFLDQYRELATAAQSFPKVIHDPLAVADVKYIAMLAIQKGVTTKPVVTLERRGSFSILQMSPTFYAAYLDLDDYLTADEMTHTNHPKKRDDFSHLLAGRRDAPDRKVGNKPGNARENIVSDAFSLLNNAEQLVEQARMCLQILADHELTQFLHISDGPYGADLSICIYDPNTSTFGSQFDDPDHIDSGVSNAVVMSIQLTEGVTPWVIGRSKASLETIYQQQGEIVIMDTLGSRKRNHPIHVVQSGDEPRVSMLIVIQGRGRDRFLAELPGLGEKCGWEPTPLDARNMRASGANIAAPQLELSINP